MTKARKSTDLLALAVSTCGVGYFPIAPGTLGSLVGVGIYLVYISFLKQSKPFLLDQGWAFQQYSALFWSITAILLVLLFIVGSWASRRTEKLHGKKDSQKIVIDEVIGQLIVFTFVPYSLSRWLIVAGFVLFRIFDIWKPYPVKAVEDIPNGIGVLADDIIAGIYAGICLGILYLISVSV